MLEGGTGLSSWGSGLAFHKGSPSRSALQNSPLNLPVLLLSQHKLILFLLSYSYLLTCVFPVFHVSLLRPVVWGPLQREEVRLTLPTAMEVEGAPVGL